MIIKGGHQITDIYHGKLRIVEVYHGKSLVYKLNKEESESCFANGYWINEYPWSNSDGWKNEN